MRRGVWLVVALVACHSSHSQPDAGAGPPDAAAACVSVAACAAPLFPIPVADTGVPSGGNSYELGLAFADFNGDGLIDVAVANGDDTVSVMSGRGARRFGPPAIYTTGQRAIRLAAGDVDKDGDVDLVVGALDPAAQTGSLRVLVNDGAGSFTVGAVYEDPSGEPALGDLDGDGLLDIVVGDGGDVGVFYNKGGDTFGARVAYPTGGQAGYGTQTPVIADLDGDHALDLVTNANATQMAVMLRRGSGYTTTLVTVSTDQYATVALRAGDFDHDHDTDVVVDTLGMGGESVRVMANNGAGGFTALAPTALATNLTLEAAGDLDGDGAPDLVVRSTADHHLGVLLGDGAGAFTAQALPATLSADFAGLVDLDGDAKLDLAYSWGTGSDGVVASVGGRGDGTFETPLALPGADGPFVPAVIVDVDGDGKPDIVRGGANLEVFRNLGDHFAGPVQVPTSSAAAIAIGDLDGDGRRDLLIGTYGSGGTWSIQIVLGTASGFVPAGTFATDAEPVDIAIADVDGDRRPDLVVACAGTPPPPLGRPSAPGGLDVFHNDGGGTFSLATKLDGQYVHVAAGDVDHDGDIDLLVDRTYGAQPIGQLLTGNGDGTFGAALTLPGHGYQLIDMTRDGIEDEVWTGDGDALMIAVGRGGGVYDAPIAGPANLLAVGDVDGDCIPDVITRDTRVFFVFHGNGDATFDPTARFEGDATSALQIADLDGDGLPDLLIGPDQVQYQRCAP